MAGVQTSAAGVSVNEKIISNNSYAHDEEGDNPRKEKEFDGVLYKLWPLQAPWERIPHFAA